MQSSTRLAVIAESQGFYSAGLAALLSQKLGIRSMPVRNLEQAIHALGQAKSTTLLTIDCTLLGDREIQTTRMLRDRFPTTPMLLTRNVIDRQTVFDLIGAGAYGVISKCAETEDLLLALRTVLAGQIFVPASVRDQPVNQFINSASLQDSATSLTRRQSQVVALMCEGKSNKAIARELGISPSTVKVHLHAVFRSLGVHSRVGAASASFERQLSTLRLEAT